MNTGNLALAILILLCLAAKPALAGLGVNGALFLGVGNPGDNVSHSMIVSINKGDSPKDITVRVMGFGQTPSGTYSPISPENDDSSCSARPFLKVNPSEFHLEGGDSQEVLLTGRIPEDVGDGGRYALVTIRHSSKEAKSVGIAVGVDVPFLLTINGTEQIYTGEIADIEINEAGTEPGMDVSVLFNNTGNHHYKARVEAVLEDNGGEVLAEASTPPGVRSIIPPNSRIFKLNLRPSTELAPGTYYVKVTVIQEDGTILASEKKSVEI